MAELRFVGPAGSRKSRAGRPKSVASAARSGDQRELLVAMQVRLAKAVDRPDVGGLGLAALVRRLLEIGRELEKLGGAGGSSVVVDAPTEPWRPSLV